MFIPFSNVFHKRFMLPFFALLLLSGCGQALSSQSPQQTPVSLHAGSTAPTSRSALLATSVAFDLGGWIHVQSGSGFACADGNPSSPPGRLVLPRVQQTYDQGTLQPVENYVSALLNNIGDYRLSAGRRDTVPYPAFSANPNAFQLVAVSNVIGGCNEILHITNIRNVPVQITSASVQLTADTQINNQHYNLIEGCSLVSRIPGCEGSVGGGEGEYTIAFDLHPGKANTIIGCNCSSPSLTLRPGEVARVLLSYFTPPSNNLSFSLMPSFTLGSPGQGKQTTYSAPQLQETFAFAFASQFTCYSLQGQQFNKVTTSQIQSGTWCI